MASASWAATASGLLNFPEEQADWLGQPAQAEALPASSDCGPTHPSFALDGGGPAAGEAEEEDMVFYSGLYRFVEAVAGPPFYLAGQRTDEREPNSKTWQTARTDPNRTKPYRYPSLNLNRTMGGASDLNLFIGAYASLEPADKLLEDLQRTLGIPEFLI